MLLLAEHGEDLPGPDRSLRVTDDPHENSGEAAARLEGTSFSVRDSWIEHATAIRPAMTPR
ncbi:MAG: hypothetical protein ACPGPE_02425 [Planctomycetota bacterium]